MTYKLWDIKPLHIRTQKWAKYNRIEAVSLHTKNSMQYVKYRLLTNEKYKIIHGTLRCLQQVTVRVNK